MVWPLAALDLLLRLFDIHIRNCIKKFKRILRFCCMCFSFVFVQIAQGKMGRMILCVQSRGPLLFTPLVLFSRFAF